MAGKVVKSRYWGFISYPDSLPDDWPEIIEKVGLPFSVSPLHDRDVDVNGVIKKFHYHNLICFPGPTTFNRVKSITDSLNASSPEVISSVRGNFRYFTHRDNPEKAQYSESDILYFNGFCPTDYFSLTSSEEDKLYSELLDFIRDRGIFEYSDFVFLLKDEGLVDYLSFAVRHTYFFNSLLRSRFNIRMLSIKEEGGAGEP